MVTWGDHRISPDSSKRLLIGETEAPRSISQCEIHPCLPPTSLWVLEILLGEKIRRERPSGWKRSGSRRGRSRGGSRGRLLLRPCLWLLPPHLRAWLPRLRSEPNTTSLLCSLLPLKVQQQMGTVPHRSHLPRLLKSLNSSASVKNMSLQATTTFLQIDSWKQRRKGEPGEEMRVSSRVGRQKTRSQHRPMLAP